MADSLTEFMRIMKKVRVSMEKVLVSGEYDEFPDKNKFHGYARIAEMLHKYSKGIPSECPVLDGSLFLMEELTFLEEAKGIHLPNFLPRSAFLTLLRKKIQTVSHMPRDFVNEVLDYVEQLVIGILLTHSENYPQLCHRGTRAVHSLIEKMRNRSCQFVRDMIEMELVADFTSNPDYLKSCTDLMKDHEKLTEIVGGLHSRDVVLGGFGFFCKNDVRHLENHNLEAVKMAFDMRVRLVAYWKCVILRLVDGVALHVLYSLKCMVEKELESVLVEELIGPEMNGIEKIMEESPAISTKRELLCKSIELLKKSKEVVFGVMDRVVIGQK